MDVVRFHFDPICPWCYQTSRWAKRVEQLGEIELDWGLFSLEVVNLKDGADPRELQARSGPALRTATLIRERKGGAAIGPFYTALGKRIWEQSPPEQDMATAVRGCARRGRSRRRVVRRGTFGSGDLAGRPRRAPRTDREDAQLRSTDDRPRRGNRPGDLRARDQRAAVG